MTTTAQPARTPARLGECERCGGKIGWIELPGRVRRPVDLRPALWGEYVLLRDGFRAVSLRDDHLAPAYEGFAEQWPELVYVDHRRTCAPVGYSVRRAVQRVAPRR